MTRRLASLESLESRTVLAGGPYIHVHDANQLAVVDAATGAVQKLGDLSRPLADIAFSPQGKLYGITADTLYEVDPVTAALTNLGAHGIPDANGLVFGPNGKLYIGARSLPFVYIVGDLTKPATNTPVSLPSLEPNEGTNGDISFLAGDLIVAATNNSLMRYRFDIDPNRPRLIAELPLARNDLFGTVAVDNSRLFGITDRSVVLFNLDATPTIRTEVDVANTLGTLRGAAYFSEAGGPLPIGTLAGIKWQDDNADGIKQAGERLLEDWQVYVDRNVNGVLDVGEPQSKTDALGRYYLFGNVPGLHTIDEIVPSQAAWERTTPRTAHRHLVADYDFDNGTAQNRLPHGFGLPSLINSSVNFSNQNAVFSGPGSFLELPVALGATPFTIAIDATYDFVTTQDQVLVSQRLNDTASSQDHSLLVTSGSPALRGIYCNGAGTCSTATTGTVNNERHRYALTWDGSRIGSFFDTTLQQQQLTGALPDIDASVLHFGNPSSRTIANAVGAKGTIHGIRIYNKALTATELQNAFSTTTLATAYSVYLPPSQAMGTLNFGNRAPGTSTPAEIEVRRNTVDGPVITSNGAAVDLGTATPSQAAPTTQLWIKNTGTTALQVTSITSSTGFALTGTTSGTLQPNQSASFTVTLTDKTIGDKTGELRIANSDSDENPFIIPLRAKITPVSTEGQRVLLSDNSGRLLSFNPADSSVEELSGLLPTFTDIAQHPTLGTLYGIDSIDVYQIAADFQSAQRLFSHGVPNAAALTFSPTGSLLAAGTNIYEINLVGGSSSLFASLFNQQAADMAYFKNQLYLTTESGNLYRVSPPTPTLVGSLGGVAMRGLAAVSDTALYGFSGNQAYLIDTESAIATPNGSFIATTITGATPRVSTVVTLHNSANPPDVTGDDIISPIDALLIINELNARTFTDPSTGQIIGRPVAPTLYPDVNDDGFISPLDALLVINALNAAAQPAVPANLAASDAEGESPSSSASVVDIAFAILASDEVDEQLLAI